MKTARYFISLLLFTGMHSGTTCAQVVIRPGTDLGFNDRPDVTIQATGNITTNNTTDFSAANLQLILAADLALTGNIIASQLTLAGGNAALNNNLTVSQSISFAGGLLTPAATARLSYTGNGQNITGGSKDSYINGAFYQSGGGYRFFPVGINGTYAPAVFDNISSTDETGLEVVAADAALTIGDPTEITAIDPAHYWLLTTADPAGINSRVSLGLNGISTPGEGSLAVIQADAPGAIATSLGVFSTDDTQVTSRGVVRKPLIAIGTIPTVVVKVRDLITPFDGADNNSLYIEKIDAFDSNTVTLMDRWGVVVKRWENFTNDVDYDFTQLSPGNYIVVVEFGNNAEGSTKEKISQMVTVLKTN